MRKGDVIKAFEGKRVDLKFNLSQEVWRSRSRAKVRLGIIRDGKSVDLTVTLTEAPADM